MTRILALLTLTLTLSAAHAARNPKYTLYYLDQTGRVCSAGISAHGNVVARPHRLTSGSGYGGYSVTRDGNQVFGWKQIGLKYGEFPVYKCFLEKGGRQPRRILSNLMADGDLSASWSPQSKFLIVTVPQQVYAQTIIYSPERRKITCDTTDLLPDFSYDQAYSFVLEDRGDDDNSPAWLSILDMQTGKMTKVAQLNFGVYGDGAEYVWFGESHRFAFIDIKGNLGAGEAYRSKSGLSVKKRALTSTGGCTDLRYVSGKGIYFARKSGTTQTPYYSSDLRALSKTAVLPAEHTEAPRWYTEMKRGRFYSPDNRLFATVESQKPGTLGRIVVYDKSGRCVGVALGKRPSWRGGAQD